jgi:hypothetical protein
VRKQDIRPIARQGIDAISPPAGIRATPLQAGNANVDVHLPRQAGDVPPETRPPQADRLGLSGVPRMTHSALSAGHFGTELHTLVNLEKG